MRRIVLVAGLLGAAACSSGTQAGGSTAAVPVASTAPSGGTAGARLAASSRHGEWVMVRTGASDSVRAWIVYPERRTKAPVVVVIHDNAGLSIWIRSVSDQLAAEGYIAIVPDLLTRFDLPNTSAGEPNADSVRAHLREITADAYQPQIRAAAQYAMNLPAAEQRYGVLGFCWGGEAAFEYGARYQDAGAIVSFYGPTPRNYDRFQTPVLGLYGENDARVNATIARADSAAKVRGFIYEKHTFAGAGHGFTKSQDVSPANAAAAQQAWPLAVAWFRKHLGA